MENQFEKLLSENIIDAYMDMTITKPTNKKGDLVYFKIRFEKSKFELVLKELEKATIENISKSMLWKVV